MTKWRGISRLRTPVPRPLHLPCHGSGRALSALPQPGRGCCRGSPPRPRIPEPSVRLLRAGRQRPRAAAPQRGRTRHARRPPLPVRDGRQGHPGQHREHPRAAAGAAPGGGTTRAVPPGSGARSVRRPKAAPRLPPGPGRARRAAGGAPQPRSPRRADPGGGERSAGLRRSPAPSRPRHPRARPGPHPLLSLWTPSAAPCGICRRRGEGRRGSARPRHGPHSGRSRRMEGEGLAGARGDEGAWRSRARTGRDGEGWGKCGRGVQRRRERGGRCRRLIAARAAPGPRRRRPAAVARQRARPRCRRRAAPRGAPRAPDASARAASPAAARAGLPSSSSSWRQGALQAGTGTGMGSGKGEREWGRERERERGTGTGTGSTGWPLGSSESRGRATGGLYGRAPEGNGKTEMCPLALSPPAIPSPAERAGGGSGRAEGCQAVYCNIVFSQFCRSRGWRMK